MSDGARCSCGVPMAQHLRCHVCGGLVGGAFLTEAHPERAPLFLLCLCASCRRFLGRRLSESRSAEPPGAEAVLTVAEAARSLRLQPATVRRLIKRGTLEGITRGAATTKHGRRWLVRRSEVERLLAREIPP